MSTRVSTLSGERALSPICWWGQRFEDELLYSYAARLANLNSLGTSRLAIAALFGSNSGSPSVDLPSCLQATFDRLAPSGEFNSVDHMINTSTLYPYYRSFMARRNWERTRAIALSNDGSGLKTFLGLVASGINQAKTIKVCPSCQRQSDLELGSAYWQRAHQLPGVKVCYMHFERLVDAVTIPSAAYRNRLLGPAIHQAGVIPRTVKCVQDDIEASEFQKRLAVNSMKLLQADQTSFEPDYCLAKYRHALSARGYMTASGRVRRKELHRALSAHVKGEIELRASVGSTRSCDAATFVMRAAASRERYVHPLAHLALIDFLFGSLELFVAAQVQQSEARLPAGTLPASGAPVPPPAPNVRSSETGNTAARDRGCTNDDQVAPLAAQGHPIARIAASLGVSISFVYRYLDRNDAKHAWRLARYERELAAKRTAWLDLSRVDPLKSKTDLRRVQPALFAWLYRNDGQWLKAQGTHDVRPKERRSRIDWHLRDTTLSSLALGPEGGDKETRSQLIRRLSKYCAVTTMRRNAERLPQTWKIIANRKEH